MKISYTLNGRARTDEVDPVQPLTEYLRAQGCLSVKRGCETSNCGLCTVLVDGRPVLSCTTLTARINNARFFQNGKHFRRLCKSGACTLKRSIKNP